MPVTQPATLAAIKRTETTSRTTLSMVPTFRSIGAPPHGSFNIDKNLFLQQEFTKKDLACQWNILATECRLNSSNISESESKVFWVKLTVYDIKIVPYGSHGYDLEPQRPERSNWLC
jgi:hypothetical protein